MNKDQAQKIITMNTASYQKIAPFFAQTRDYVWPELRVTVEKHLSSHMRILDIGCGSGRVYGMLEGRDVLYDGVDASVHLVEQACSRFQIEKIGEGCANDHVSFHVADALSLPQQSETYDMALLVAVLNHFPQAMQSIVLEQAYRVLKPGGVLIMTNWNLWQTRLKKTAWGALRERFILSNEDWHRRYLFSKKELGIKDVMTQWEVDTLKEPLYYYAFTLRELRRKVKAVGFHVEDAYYGLREGRGHWYNGQNLIIVARKYAD